MSGGTILIVSSSTVDVDTVGLVREYLENKGYEVAFFDADQVIKGVTPFEVHIGASGLRICYDGKLIDTKTVDAAWFRKPTALSYMQGDLGRAVGLMKECELQLEVVWDSLPETVWLNSPRLIKWHSKKILQLRLAQSVGFKVPETVVSNRWRSVEDRLIDYPIIVKMVQGHLYGDNNETRTLQTTLLKKRDDLPLQTNPFPGMWQSYLRKKKEWRVTVVGEQVFGAAIYTSTEAKDDWRRHAFTGDVEFKKEHFPNELGDKCLRLLRKMGLRYGAFDFVEDDEGTITFLEVNTNGQYLWLENALDLPISNAIAEELMAIAKR